MIRAIISLVSGLVTGVAMFLVGLFASLWWMIVIIAVWMGILSLAYFYIYQKSDQKWLNYSLLMFTIISLFSLLLFIEWQVLHYLLFILGVAITAFIFSRLPIAGIELSYQQKPMRRGIIMLWVFNLYVLLSTLFAVNIYFPNVPFILLEVIGAGLIFYSTIIVWRSYLHENNRRLFFWAGVIALGMLEILWVIHLLPLGHFVLGAVSAWLWYVGVLLTRFNLVEQGIVWRKQAVFLIANAVLLFLFLFFIVRWI